MNFRVDHDLTLDIIENQLGLLAERQCDLHATEWDQARLAGVQRKAAEALAKVAQPDDIHYVARGAIPAADAKGRSREDVNADMFQVEYASLVRLAYVLLQDRSRAEDVVMRAFCSRYVHWSGVRRKSAPLTCLRTEVLYWSRSRVHALVRERTGRLLSEVGVPDPSSRTPDMVR